MVNTFAETPKSLKGNHLPVKGRGAGPKGEARYPYRGQAPLIRSHNSRARVSKLANAKRWLGDIEQRLRRKQRCYRLKQCKRKFAIAKFLMKNGVPEWRAWLLAGSGKGWYRMAESPQAHEAMNIRWFAEQGLMPLALPR